MRKSDHQIRPQERIKQKDGTEDELDRFFELVLDVLVIAGFDGYFKKVSRSFQDLMGYSREELLSHPILSFVEADDQDDTSMVFNDLLKGEPVYHFENRLRTSEGEVKWIAWRAVAVEEEGRIHATARNITEKKLLEAARVNDQHPLSKIHEDLDNDDLPSDEQKALFKEQNEEIISSLKYALRIQNGLLPSEKGLKEDLDDHFVIFHPRDIVSGDIYWGSRPFSDHTLFSVMDCTGHGVPGAFLSVLGLNELKRCTEDYGLLNPAGILGYLRRSFTTAFTDISDGMDMALCTIDHTKGLLYFAGANNPAYIIRANENIDPELYENPSIKAINEGGEGYSLIELKPDKRPIGPINDHIPFTLHQFPLVQGDAIYLFSDGIVDQFGGDQDKKFKPARFRELLLNIQEKNMEEQKASIEAAFQKWKQRKEQVDDVCVMGFRY